MFLNTREWIFGCFQFYRQGLVTIEGNSNGVYYFGGHNAEGAAASRGVHIAC